MPVPAEYQPGPAEGGRGLKRIRAIPLSMKRIVACARGRVQGVGYRSYVSGCARGTGVTGFVKNMPDGSVTVVAEGSDDSLGRFAGMLHAHGDALIRVESLEVMSCEPTGEFTGFWIRW